MKLTDEFINDFRSSKQYAFEQIYQDYFINIRNYINKIIKIEAEAEELAHDVLMKLWENRDSIDQTRNLKAFLIVSARNAALDSIKRKATEKKYIETEKYVGDFTTEFESDFLAKELNLMIKLLVSEMPKQRRTVYVMSQEKGLSAEEIAAELNISVKTVYRHLEIAKKYLQQMLFIFSLILSILQMRD